MKINKKRVFLVIILVIIVLIIMVNIIMKIHKEVVNYFKNDTTYIYDPETAITDKELKKFLKKETYYIEKYLSRYISYARRYPKKDMAEVIRSVNSNIDNEFYTNVIDSNLDDGVLILVNKYNKLNKDSEPNLVDMSDNYSRATIKKMQSIAYNHLQEMINMAALDGIILYDVSSYRSYSYQNGLYNNYVERDGKTAADKYSARAGYSEHQTGLATDLNTALQSDHFENSKEYAWLQKNAYKYGFILRYPKDKEYLTGYMYEPWHYRYVGKDVAKYIKEHDITFEEYYAFFVANK